MISRDLSQVTNLCQLQHKPLPPHFEFVQPKPKNVIKKYITLLTMKMFYQLKKKYSHPTLVEYGDDQFTLRILDKSSTVTNTPLDSFSFESV